MLLYNCFQILNIYSNYICCIDSKLGSKSLNVIWYLCVRMHLCCLEYCPQQVVLYGDKVRYREVYNRCVSQAIVNV